MKIASASDFREAAKRRLPHMLFEYIDGGATCEVTLAQNLSDFENVRLRQRVMVDGSRLDLSTRLLGKQFSLPVGLAPVGMAGMYARRGEKQAAAAASGANVPFCLSTVGICSATEVAQAAQPPWFQLYMLRDRQFMISMLEGARRAGCEVLVVTVDLPTPGSRYRDIRSGFTGAGPLEAMARRALDGFTHPRWLWDVYLRGRPHTLGNVVGAMSAEDVAQVDFLAWLAANFDPSATWRDIELVRRHWDGPMVIKGILDLEDARSAVGSGCDAIVVSNHGGRQLDGVRSSISALPEIAAAFGDRVEVYLDGGVRSGVDVLKALALGARACFLGRPWAFALAADGQAGVEKLLEIIRAELSVAMVLTGCTSIEAASGTLLDHGPTRG